MSKNNILLKNLINPTLPEQVSWFPQTIGWKVLALLCLFVLFALMAKFYQQYKKDRYRRTALQAINELDRQNPALILEQLNRLLKISAIHAYPHQTVAPLQGETWLLFLDFTCQKDTFNNELMQKWQTCLYKPFDKNEWKNTQIEALITYSQSWICHHHAIDNDQVESDISNNKDDKNHAI